MRKKILAAVAAGAIAALGAIAPASADTSSNAVLSVLHGIPDTPVDVYVNGELTIDDFEPGTLAGPLDLPAGDYQVALTAPDATDAPTSRSTMPNTSRPLSPACKRRSR